jgi:hypothetical protein
VTGGGAYKYAELIEKKLGLKIAKEPVGHISGTVLSAVVTIAYLKEGGITDSCVSGQKN